MFISSLKAASTTSMAIGLAFAVAFAGASMALNGSSSSAFALDGVSRLIANYGSDPASSRLAPLNPGVIAQAASDQGVTAPVIAPATLARLIAPPPNTAVESPVVDAGPVLARESSQRPVVAAQPPVIASAPLTPALSIDEPPAPVPPSDPVVPTKPTPVQPTAVGATLEPITKPVRELPAIAPVIVDETTRIVETVTADAIGTLETTLDETVAVDAVVEPLLGSGSIESSDSESDDESLAEALVGAVGGLLGGLLP
jgi:hypothetical protein